MLDYLADAGELVIDCEPCASACVPQQTVESRQDDYSNWGNYALFLSEQQGSYCQLV